MIELDGSYGSGGGALVRVALALSTLTNQPFKVNNIRAGKEDQGGLKAQHLHAIKALKEICGAKTSEIEIGTKEFWYHPGKIKAGIYEIDIGTAGSITLFLQAIILPCLFAPNKITLKIKGGTCGKWQASVDYLQNILIPHLRKFVEKIELKIFKRGYYPKGGGEVQLEISPKFKLNKYSDFKEFNSEIINELTTIKLTTQGNLEQIKGVINLSRELEQKEIGERIKRSAESYLKNFNVPINIRLESSQTLSIGGEIVLWALFSDNGEMNFENPVILGSDALLEKSKSSEQIGKEVATKLNTEIKSGASVDSHLADQLIPFMALLPDSKIETSRISNHSKTNIYVVEKFLNVKFQIKFDQIIVTNL